jgi:N utilization substance protein B
MTSDPADRIDGIDDTTRPQDTQSAGGGARKKKKGKHGNVPGGIAPGARIDRSAPLHQARVLAMQALYEHDLTQHELDEILERLTTDEDEEVPAPVAQRVVQLVSGVADHQAELDPHIASAAPQFPIPQLAAVDRNVLRLAVYELYHAPDVPYKVVINEAVEIAKRFGGPNSGRFVNGVLGTIVDRLPAERKAKTPS